MLSQKSNKGFCIYTLTRKLANLHIQAKSLFKYISRVSSIELAARSCRYLCEIPMCADILVEEEIQENP